MKHQSKIFSVCLSALLAGLALVHPAAAAETPAPRTADYAGQVRFLDADDFTNVAPGQKGTFRMELDPLGPVETTGSIQLTAFEPETFFVDENGNWEAKQEGVAYLHVDWDYSRETIEALKKLDPDFEYIKPDCAVFLQIVVSNTSSVFRLYNPNSGEHVFTADRAERTNLISAGWNDESIRWLNCADQSRPVWRLYNPNAGDHHYTMNPEEAERLSGLGWRNEGVKLYADDETQIPVYRLYNPNALRGSHHFTTDLNEYSQLAQAGWKQEGIAFYASSSERLPQDDPMRPVLPEGN